MAAAGAAPPAGTAFDEFIPFCFRARTGLAPCARKSFTAVGQPLFTAMERIVLPRSSTALTSAPVSSNHMMASQFPSSTAT